MMIRFFAESFSKELLERARQDVCRTLQLVCQYQAKPEQYLQEWAGGSLKAMRENLNALLDALRHTDPQIRHAALFVIRDFWPELEELVSECLRAGFEGPDPTTRGIALHVTSHFYGWIDDPSGVLDTILWSYEDPADSRATEGINAIKQTRKFRTQVLHQRRKVWRELIGTQIDEMLRNRQVAELHMNSIDTNLRYVAVAMMSCDWKPTRQAAEIAKTLMVQDSDPRVQKGAIAVVLSFYAGTKNKKVTKLFVDILSDGLQSAEIRMAAYQGLFQVQGIPMFMWPIVVTAPDKFRVPQDIDWAFVNSLR